MREPTPKDTPARRRVRGWTLVSLLATLAAGCGATAPARPIVAGSVPWPAAHNRRLVAHYTRVSPKDVTDLQAFVIKGTARVNVALVATIRNGEHRFPAVVLLRCDPQTCQGGVVPLASGPVDHTSALQVLDLAQASQAIGGGSTPLSTSVHRRTVIDVRGLKHPALVVTTTHETRTRRVVSKTGKTEVGRETLRRIHLVVLNARSLGQARVATLTRLAAGATGGARSSRFRTDTRSGRDGFRDLVEERTRSRGRPWICSPRTSRHRWSMSAVGRYQEVHRGTPKPGC